VQTSRYRLSIKKVLIVHWRDSGRRTILANLEDQTAGINILEKKSSAESLKWKPSIEAWEKLPPGPSNNWSTRAAGIVLDEMKKSGQVDRVNEVIRACQPIPSLRRLSQFRAHVARKIISKKIN